jgi:choline dehydrogenase-like flavoprotein
MDYIVVGGGAAGCVIASRLSENPDIKVTLIEQGPRDWNPYIHIPVTYYKTAKGGLLSRYDLEPLPPDRREAPLTEMVQGRVLGGGSSVNGMVYMRGIPEDYDGWEASGCPGWSWRDVLPWFRKSETNERFAGDAHGSDGPLHVSDQRQTLPLTKAWLKACQSKGIPYNPDFNDGDQLGCGLYQVMMHRGRRNSAARAYLRPALRRSNLTVETGRAVTRILVEDGRATGVETIRDGARETLRAEREVIVCAGGIGSPHLLLRSGIGPADHLRAVGVDVTHDLPGVGRNLQDHVDVFMIYELTGPHSYDRYKKLHWQALAGLQYLLFRNGPVTSNIAEGGMCWYGSRPERGLPEIQYHFLCGAGVEEGGETTPSGNGCTINVGLMRPESRGRLTLRSADPMAPPWIEPNYISAPYDVECLVAGVQTMQEIMESEAMAPWIRGVHRPGQRLTSRAEVERFVRETVQTAVHPCGACKMGTDDLAVVDPQFRVHGLDGLRVADSSAMPALPSGNLNGPTVMMGERAAHFVRGNA